MTSKGRAEWARELAEGSLGDRIRRRLAELSSGRSVADKRRAVLEEVLYDEASFPADRLKAAELLERLEGPDDEALAWARAAAELTPEEAADYLRCSRQRVYDLLSSRRLTRYRDGSRVLVRRDELDSYLRGERAA